VSSGPPPSFSHGALRNGGGFNPTAKMATFIDYANACLRRFNIDEKEFWQ